MLVCRHKRLADILSEDSAQEDAKTQRGRPCKAEADSVSGVERGGQPANGQEPKRRKKARTKATQYSQVPDVAPKPKRISTWRQLKLYLSELEAGQQASDSKGHDNGEESSEPESDGEPPELRPTRRYRCKQKSQSPQQQQEMPQPSSVAHCAVGPICTDSAAHDLH